jgi:hypothetical protein
MPVEVIRTGGCACGAVRYEVTGDPFHLAVCHCKLCQRRTGSAFGISCFYPTRSLRVVQSDLKTWERSSDSGRMVRCHFCRRCGSTVLWNLEVFPEATGIAGGSFDDTDWIQPERHGWASMAHKWTRFPDEVEVGQQE